MKDVNEQAERVLTLARAGDIAGAIVAGEAALSVGAPDAGLAMFVGVLCCRQGEVVRGITHLRRAVDLAPGELTARVELARALLASGANSEAELLTASIASPASPLGREMQRVQAHALLRQSRTADGIALFEQLTVAEANDFESWDGLGVGRLALGEIDDAILAFKRATQLRPTAIAYWSNLARAYGAAGDFKSAVIAARRATAQAPDDAAAQIELARALAGLDRCEEALGSLTAALTASAGNADLISEIADVEFTCKAFERSEASYRAVLALQPTQEKAWLGLGKLLERTNRTSELHDTLDAAEAAGVSVRNTALLRAQALRAQGLLEEALAATRAAPTDVAPVLRAQLIGDISDRLGDADTAFSAFSEANALSAQAAGDSVREAENYRATFARLTNLVTERWYKGWPPALRSGLQAAPLFIFGFPRSGTTLIDTMLSGHPNTVVLEEEPTIDNLAEAFGSADRLPELSPEEMERLRQRYFDEVAKVAPSAGRRLIVDKNPLGLSATPLLFRLFPDARFVFVERHPCDVVLSCFIMSSQMNAKVANFFDFTSTALLYDRVLGFWERCRETFPLRLHTIRYEQLIADPEPELRSLAEFASLSWDPKLLAHQSNASARAYIDSPSYAQVTEPLYTRAMGRWRRYRSHIEPALPILLPWIEKMGYNLD